MKKRNNCDSRINNPTNRLATMTPANTANGVRTAAANTATQSDRLIRTAYANNNAHEANVASPAQTPVSTPIPSNCAPFDCPECNAPAYSNLRRRTPNTPTNTPIANPTHGIHRVERFRYDARAS